MRVLGSTVRPGGWAAVVLTGVQVRAARAMLRWEIADLAAAAGVSEAEIARLEAHDGPSPADLDHAAVARALEEGGVELLEGGAPGVRLRPQAESLRPEELNAENDG
jgi:transcriptional regulator with XRE-family HTH domain